MKKVQRSFAVEYKSGRRKDGAKPNSIWGNIDLKSVARDVEEAAMPFVADSPLGDEPKMEASSPKANRILPTLTPPVATSKAAPATQEIFMAGDTDPITNADAPAAFETPIAPKKQRKPRTMKASAETAAAADAAAETAVGPDGGRVQKKRGRKAEVIEGAAVAKRTPVRRALKDKQTATVAPTSVGDDMADLLQLEEENKKLRKMLADKLRAENAELRKKLTLG